ncbi:IclR family transcriptional regulator [Lysinibacillus macroides]|uniref:IclR family transcriptional regulator n=1 Tax=Lysinibacillus macroides TaxID=33935 RepID=A0A0M9DMC6_9BACI|nr:IclR family transcriptional regulator [Lysinibacillus macroides]KOY83839.1 hypothetical protein ADM90_02805 [Lysinibacillus macroides]QPR67113.1 IclR family transcriptional regulator [Lysinibacillus macroides]
MTTQNKSSVQSIERALDLLEIIAQSQQPVSLHELIEKTSLNRTTIWRIIGTLEARGYIEKVVDTKNYRIGGTLYQLVQVDNVQRKLVEIIRPYMIALMEEFQETILFSVYHNGQMLHLEQVNPNQSIILKDYRNSCSPLHCSSNGKLQLAYFDDKQLDIFLRQELDVYSTNTLTDVQTVRRELEIIRQRHYSLSVGEYDVEENAISVAITYRGSPVGFISVGGPAYRLTEQKLHSIAHRLLAITESIEINLS